MIFTSYRVEDKYEKCEIIDIPHKYDFKPCGMALQKNSPYLEIFDYYLKEIMERGMIEQIESKYEIRPQICPDNSGSSIGNYFILRKGTCINHVDRNLGNFDPLLSMLSIDMFT